MSTTHAKCALRSVVETAEGSLSDRLEKQLWRINSARRQLADGKDIRAALATIRDEAQGACELAAASAMAAEVLEEAWRGRTVTARLEAV